MERNGTLVAARAIVKEHRRAGSSHRCWPISTCTYWTGYGSGNNLQQKLGARIVRYADDIVILCRRSQSGQVLMVLRQILERLELNLNETKTKTVNAYQGKFDFLGFSIGIETSKRTGKYYPHVQPSKKALQTIKDRVTQLTRRVTTVKPLERIVWEVNITVRGWVNYFHYRNCSKTMTKVRGHVEARLQTHLRKRHKVRDRGTGYARFSSRALYEKYGLYKVPTTAAWTKAHALR